MGGGGGEVAVLAPSLGAPLVVVLVVPFVIGLGVVGFGPGAVVRLLDAQVLVATPAVPVGAGLAPVAGLTLLGGGVVVGTGVLAVGVAAVAALAVAAVAGAAVGAVGLLAPLGGGGAGGLGVAGVVSVVVLSPLVVIGLHASGVGLVVVRLGGDGVVGFAPSGVVVGAIGLLGPFVVVVGTGGGLAGGGSALPVAGGLTVAGLTGSGVLGAGGALGVAVGAVCGAVATVATVLGA